MQRLYMVQVGHAGSSVAMLNSRCVLSLGHLHAWGCGC